MAGRGEVLRIGVLLPSSNSVAEPSLCAALPRRTTLHVARMRLANVEAESIERVVEEIDSESRKLADVDVDVIVLAATAPSSRKGLGYDRELIGRIAAASGKPATTAATAMIEALRALAVARIALAAPWSEAVNRTSAAFIEQSGFQVVAQEALGLVRNLDIGLLDPQSGDALGRRVDRPDADAIMLACGNWNVFDVIEPLERDLGKPVLTTNQVSFWHALKIAGGGPVDRLGVLLREHLGEGAAARDAASAA